MRNIALYAFAVSSCLLAAGCTPYYDTEAARREQARQDDIARDRADSATCINYGTVMDTPAYSDCRRDLERNRPYNYDNYAPAAYTPRDAYRYDRYDNDYYRR